MLLDLMIRTIHNADKKDLELRAFARGGGLPYETDRDARRKF